MRDRLDITLARRINGERLVLLGWPRAILLQIAHPLVAEGVYHHSGFRQSPLAAVGRLRATVRAMLAIAFGDQQRQRQAIDGIRAIHRRVHGTLDEQAGLFPAGTPYSAEDPALVLWVHTTLVESTLLTYELLVQSLSESERDRYCAASASIAVALGALASDVPQRWKSLVDMNARLLATPTIHVSPHARKLAEALLRGPLLRATPPAAWATRLITTGLLPPSLRAAYGLEWNDRHERMFKRMASVVRRMRRLSPARLARFADARRPAHIR